MGFSIGDRVRVISRFDGRLMPGFEGTVITTCNSPAYEVGVEFDESFADGHSCRGLGENGHCRYGFNSELELIATDAEIVTEESEELKDFISGFNIK